MAILRLRVSAEMNDQFFPDLPVVLRREYDEVLAFEFDQVSAAATYVDAPLDALGTIQALILQPDEDITVRLAGQTNGGMPVLKGGIFTLADTDLDNSGGAAVKILNESGNVVTIRGVACGT